MLNFNYLGTLKGSSSVQVNLRRTCSTMSHIVTKYGKVFQEQKMVYSAKCRECGHFIGRSNFDFMKKQER